MFYEVVCSRIIMKTKKSMGNFKFYPLLIILLGLTTVAFAQTEADANLNIVIPIAIENNTELNFGIIVASGSAGTVRITPTGTRSRTGGATFISSMPGTVSAAQFTVNGMSNATYSLTLPSNTAVRISSPGGVDMQVRQFRSSLDSQAPKLNSSGTQTFTVGATLRVNANQAPGIYTGTFNITVAYN